MFEAFGHFALSAKNTRADNYLAAFLRYPEMVFSVSLVLAALAAPLGLASPLLTCQEAFKNLDANLEKIAVASFNSEETLEPTVIFGEKISGIHGGKRITLKKREGLPWSSGHRTQGYDPQGDPRWPIRVLGQDSANFFGFKLLPQDKMLIPDQQELIGAIEKVNQRLMANGQEPIGVKFYPVENNNVSVRKYVKSFQEASGLPLGANGNHYLHDLSFHSGAIFLPNSLLKHTSERLRFQESFFEFLEKKYAKNPNLSRLSRELRYAMEFDETTGIDNATGLITNNILRTLEKKGAKNEMAETALMHLRAELKPIDNLGVFLYNIRDDVRDVDSMYFRMNPERRKFLMDNYSGDKSKADLFAQDLRDFAEKYQSPKGFSPHQSYAEAQGHEDLEELTEKLCTQMTLKRKEIIEASK